MQIELEVRTKETIEVDFPYYYEQYLDSEYSTSTIYGKIEPNCHTTIRLSGNNVEIEIKNQNAGTLGCYFTDEYASDEKSFAKALERAKQIVDRI